MDRRLVSPNEQVQDADILATNQFGMIALGRFMELVLGSATAFGGLACTPTTPASMSVQVGPGSIYGVQNLEATAYGTLAADATHTLMKQGTNLDATTLALAAPTTSGNSIVYLIQAAYSESDTVPQTIPFRDSVTGVVTQQTVPTTRKAVCLVNAKAGVSAATGSAVAPAPDAGYTGLYTVTVANGATTITSANIATLASAPFILNKLPNLAPLASPAFTGTPTAPTPATADNTTKLATTAWVKLLGASLNATPGYQKLPGGLIVQFGVANMVASGNHVNVTYPIAFPTAFLAGYTTALIDADSTANSFNTGFSNALVNPLTTGIVRNLSNAANFNVAWLSIGY